MLRAILLGLTIATAPVAALADAVTYQLDPGHTEVRFIWNHAGVSDQAGRWNKVDGTVAFDPEDLGATRISITVDPKSVNTGVPPLDKHMQGADMFDVEKHPEITFVSTGAVQTGPDHARITGNLTIKGNTHPIVLDAELVHMGEHPLGKFIDYYKGQWLGVHATGTLLRSKFGVGYAAPLTSDLIRLEIATEMKSE